MFLSTADKFLMLEGGFNVKSMEKNVKEHFGKDWIGNSSSNNEICLCKTE